MSVGLAVANVILLARILAFVMLNSSLGFPYFLNYGELLLRYNKADSS